MITGDHKLTATSVAQEIGLWEKGDEAVTGSELAEMSEAEIAQIEAEVLDTAEAWMDVWRDGP